MGQREKMATAALGGLYRRRGNVGEGCCLEGATRRKGVGRGWEVRPRPIGGTVVRMGVVQH
jgi:hypothetical protein